MKPDFMSPFHVKGCDADEKLGTKVNISMKGSGTFILYAYAAMLALNSIDAKVRDNKELAKEHPKYEIVSSIGVNRSTKGQIVEGTSESDVENIKEIADLAMKSVKVDKKQNKKNRKKILGEKKKKRKGKKKSHAGKRNNQALAEELMNSFKVEFDNPVRNTTNTTITTKNVTTITPSSTLTPEQINRRLDQDFQKLTKKVFSPRKKKHVDSEGREKTYFKDTTSVPVMFRKIIPPSKDKLPMLHFEFREGNSICRCNCKL